MWPRTLPAEILKDSKRAAEVRVFRALENSLPLPFEVFYSRPWMGLNHLGEEIDGECDFLIAHPELGILTLEVKGGGISREASSGIWRSTDRHGIRRRIKDPVRQARDAKYRILAELKKSLPTLGRINAHHGVLFPDVSYLSEDLGIDMPKTLFCCADELEHNLLTWVLQRLQSDGNLKQGAHDPLGKAGLAQLHELVAKSFYLEMPIGKRLEADDEELQTLTMRQAAMFRFISDIPRVAISGAAGTGKTVLAKQEAIRQSELGKLTALLCYNPALATQLQSDPALANRPDIHVATFPSLFSKNLVDGDIDTIDITLNPGQADHIPQFDVVVIDEGQDFPREWWGLVELILKPNGRIRVFWDSNQAVYGALPSLPQGVEFIPIRLDSNLRNTAAIWGATQRYYDGHAVTAEGPLGQPVSVKKVSSEAEALIQLKALTAGWTLGNEGNNLAILVPDQEWAKKAEQVVLSKNLRVRLRSQQDDLGGVTVDTIRRFKGLECRDVILLLNQESIVSNELVYVGLSRARVRLAVIVIGSAQIVDEFLA